MFLPLPEVSPLVIMFLSLSHMYLTITGRNSPLRGLNFSNRPLLIILGKFYDLATVCFFLGSVQLVDLLTGMDIYSDNGIAYACPYGHI